MYTFSRDMGGARALVVGGAILPLCMLARYEAGFALCAPWAGPIITLRAQCIRSGMRWSDVKNYAVCALANVSMYKEFAGQLSLPRVLDTLGAVSRSASEPETRETALRALENANKCAVAAAYSPHV